MKQDDQRNKVIVLIVLALALVGYVAYTISVSGHQSVKVAKTAKSTDPAESDVETNDVGNSLAALPNDMFPGITTPTPRRDPFYIQAPMAAAMNPEKKTNANNIQQVKTISTAVSSAAKIFNPFKMLGDILPAAPEVSEAPKVVAVPAAKPVLTGVIMGPQNIAILSYNNKNYVVEQGSSFAGKFRLVQVTRESVMLQDGGRQIRLGLGG